MCEFTQTAGLGTGATGTISSLRGAELQFVGSMLVGNASMIEQTVTLTLPLQSTQTFYRLCTSNETYIRSEPGLGG
jgi:hypothetical protein